MVASAWFDSNPWCCCREKFIKNGFSPKFRLIVDKFWEYAWSEWSIPWEYPTIVGILPVHPVSLVPVPYGPSFRSWNGSKWCCSFVSSSLLREPTGDDFEDKQRNKKIESFNAFINVLYFWLIKINYKTF